MSKSLYLCCLVWLSLPGCVELPIIEEGICGNRVIEAGEDCDGPGSWLSGPDGTPLQCGSADSSHGCSFVCEPSETPFSCPPGWGCGADGRCRPPSGGFLALPGSAGSFVEDFTLGDVDGDTTPDVIGLAGQALSVRYGDGVGDFDDASDVLIPAPSGPVGFTHFTSEERIDALVPIPQGFFTLAGEQGRSLQPYNHASFRLPDVENGRVVSMQAYLGQPGSPDLDREHLLMLELQDIIGPIDASFMNFVESGAGFEHNAIQLPKSVRKLAGEVPVADLDGDGISEFALAFRNDDKVRLYTAEGIEEQSDAALDLRPVVYPGVPGQPQAPHQLDLPADHELARAGIALFDVDGDDALDLVAATDHETDGPRVLLWRNQGDGTFAADAELADVFCTRYQVPLASCPDVPWPLAVSDFDGDGVPDYVFADGIALSTDDNGDGLADFVTPVSASPGGGSWQLAVIVDINGDGALDVAAASSERLGVDILVNAADAGTPGLFNPFHVHSASPVAFLRTGDFNGDLVQDIAIVSRDQVDPPLVPDRLLVVYGGVADGPTEALDMGSPGQVASIDSTSLVLDPAAPDAVADLIVMAYPLGGSPELQLSFFPGNASRKLVSPFFLPFSPYQVAALSAGHFNNPENPAGEPLDRVLDVVLVLAPRDDLEPIEPALAHLLAVVHGMRSEEQPGQVGFISNRVLTLPDVGVFSAPCALWVSGDIDPQGIDGAHELIGIDNGIDCDGREPSRLLIARDIREALPTEALSPEAGEQLQYQEAPPLPVASLIDLGVALDIDGVGVRDLRVVDLDRDRRPDLLISMRGADESGRLVILWNHPDCGGQVGFCAEHATIVTPAVGAVATLESILDAAAIQLDTDEALELAVLHERGVQRLDVDENRTFVDGGSLSARGPEPGGSSGRLRVRDVDGDGLQDLISSEGGRLQVYLQQRGLTAGERPPGVEPMP